MTRIVFRYDGTLYWCHFADRAMVRDQNVDIVPVMDGVVVERIELRLPDQTVIAKGLCATQP